MYQSVLGIARCGLYLCQLSDKRIKRQNRGKVQLSVSYVVYCLRFTVNYLFLMYEFLKSLNLNLLKKQPEMLLKNILPELLMDLYYPSESDEPIEVFSLEESRDLPIIANDFKTLLKREEGSTIEPLDIEQFWNSVTEINDWYGEEQIAKTKQFEKLKNTLFEHLGNVQGFRVGEVEIDVYLFGSNSDGAIEGIKTMLVET